MQNDILNHGYYLFHGKAMCLSNLKLQKRKLYEFLFGECPLRSWVGIENS